MLTFALGLLPFGEDDFLDLRMFSGFEAFGAFGNLGVFGPDHFFSLVSSPSAKVDRPLRKRFVYMNCNFIFY